MEPSVGSQCYQLDTDDFEHISKPGFVKFFGVSLLFHMALLSSFAVMQMRLSVASPRSPPIEVEIGNMEMKKAEPPPPAGRAQRTAFPLPAPVPKVARVAPQRPVSEITPPRHEPVSAQQALQPDSASSVAAAVRTAPGQVAAGSPGPVVTGATGTGPARSGTAANGENGTSNTIHDFSFGNGDGPSFLFKADPNYPLSARRMGREGKVLLRLTLDERGKLLNVEVLENPGYGFADAAVSAVKKSRFSPASINNRPVASRVRLPIRFALHVSE